MTLVIAVATHDAASTLGAVLGQRTPDQTPPAYLFLARTDKRSDSAALHANFAHAMLPCTTVTSGEQLLSGRIYIIPEWTAARVHDGNLVLKTMESSESFETAANALLASAARELKSRLIVVCLGADNALPLAGLSDVREAGGFTVHVPSRFRAGEPMPQPPEYDTVLPPEALTTELHRLVQAMDAPADAAGADVTAETLQPCLALLRTHLGYNLEGYRPSVLAQRIQRRMLLLHVQSMSAYTCLLQSSPSELRSLGNEMLVPFSRFFRDAECWATLRDLVLPCLAAKHLGNGENTPIRIWSAGCSTGEEAYSLAMLMMEYQERTGKKFPFTIFATDINSDAVLAARSGWYSRAIEQQLPAERLKRFFIREDAGYRVIPELRALCLFSQHNLCFDLPLPDTDLVVCRNTSTSFDAALRGQALATIFHSLHDAGYLMLGAAEAPSFLAESWIPLELTCGVYRKAGAQATPYDHTFHLDDHDREATGQHSASPEHTGRILHPYPVHDHDFASGVLEHIPLPIAVLGADLSFRSVNFAFQHLTATANHTLLGWSLQDFTQRFWGVSASAVELTKLAALPLGGLIETEFYTQSTPGQILLIKGQALLNGNTRIVLLVVEDVTLRRETERVLARQQSSLADQLQHRDTLLRSTRKELHDLAQHLFTVQEGERERIAGELHDDISQRLSLLQMSCASLSQLRQSPAESREIESIQQQVQSLANDVRALSHNLHPALLKQLGLVAALKSLVDSFREKENLPATLAYSIGTLRPSDLAATTCYRVTQEALRNVAKHAGRTHVKVALDLIDNRLRLQIRDFGYGFDQSSPFPHHGLGLTSMRERTRIAGGTFSIVSTLGEGTVIVVDVPTGVDA